MSQNNINPDVFGPKKRELEEKYCDLVWMARSQYVVTPEGVTPRNVLDETIDKYPEEYKKLCGPDSEWHHGFNSGMLACLRLLSGGRIYKSALEEFPFLDT